MYERNGHKQWRYLSPTVVTAVQKKNAQSESRTKKHTREHKEHARYEKPFESSRKRIDMLQLGSIHAETESETQI